MRAAVRDAEFSEFVASRRAQLRRTAYLLCGDSHRAEDLVQTVLMKLYVAWPRVRRPDRGVGVNVDAYARRMLVNAHVDEGRRPWRREWVGGDDTWFDRAEAPREFGTEDRDLLRDALAALPPRQRAAVVLRHFWGLSVEETARDLGVSTGTVKSQTSHALHRLEEALAPHYEERSRR
jgi:RNA polymerase sigma-70 factor (sigma-E family)